MRCPTTFVPFTPYELAAMRRAVDWAIAMGLMSRSPAYLLAEEARAADQRARQRLCMQRLRAEQRGQDVSAFPKRERQQKRGKVIRVEFGSFNGAAERGAPRHNATRATSKS